MKKLSIFFSFVFVFLISQNIYADNPLINMTQTVVDLNGGEVVQGDILQYSITVENNTVDTLNNASIDDLLPLGTSYIENSLSITGGGTSQITGDIAPKLEYDQTTLSPGDQIVLTYQVQVEGSPLYFVDNAANPAILYEVDKSDGSVDTIDRLTGQKNVYGLALTSDARYIYGVDSFKDRVFKYDLTTKETIEIGLLNLGNVGVPCLDFDNNGVLWGADSKKDELFQINLDTGAGTIITPLEVDIKGGDCAFGADGKLYTVSNNNAKGKGALWVVDPLNGNSTKVADISDTEFFTGVALGTDGNLFSSGNKTDGLFSISTTTGVGSLIGSFGVPHGGGDLAMTASQRLQMKSIAVYKDDEGNEETDETGIEMQGTAPPIGTGPEIVEPVIPEPERCVINEDVTICEFDADFIPFMQAYVDDVLGHHFSQVEDVAGKEMTERNLEDQSAIDFMIATNAIIVADREVARTEAHTMITDWVNTCSGQPGPCPHEHQLMQNIRETLTHRQAQAAIKVKRYNTSTPSAMECAFYAQDSTIRYGDQFSFGWDTYGGNVAGIEPYIGGVNLSGTKRLRPLETNTYQLTLHDNQGDILQCDYEVVVEPACDIGAHQEVIYRGEGTSLIWNAEGNAVAEINSGVGGVGLKGQHYVMPLETTTYKLSTYLPYENNPYKVCEYTVYVKDPGDTCDD